jgi:hypothetical protein
MLVIIYGWREDRIKKYRLWIIGLPLFIGLAFACAGIPFYDVNVSMCYLLPDSDYGTFFFTLPILTVTFFATAIMFAIYWKVYHQERRVRRWILGSNVQSLPRKVFWQGFWYLMCFYVSWPIILVFSNVAVGSLYDHFGFLCATIFFVPLQGFLNFIAYTRQRIMRCMKRHYIGLSSLIARGIKSPADASVTAAVATATSVNHQHEWEESNSSKHSVGASETAAGTAHVEAQMLDSEPVDLPLGDDANKYIAQKDQKWNITKAPKPSILNLADG